MLEYIGEIEQRLETKVAKTWLRVSREKARCSTYPENSIDDIHIIRVLGFAPGLEIISA
jgi:hypothetical protein